MAHVAAGKKTEGSVLDRASDLLDLAKNFIKDHKNGTIAALAIGGAGTALPFVLPAIANASGNNGPGSERTLALLGNDRIKELRAELLINENNLINQRHAAVASLAKAEDMPLYAPGGKVLSLEAQFAYTKEAINMAVKTVPYQANAEGAKGVLQCVDKVLESHGATQSTFRDTMARTVMTWWYAYNCDYKTTYFPELAAKGIDTPEERKAWAASQPRAIGTCIDHSNNLELHFEKAGLLPEGSGSVVMHARPIWNRNRQVNTSPLPVSSYGNHQAVEVYSVDDANSKKACLYDAYWLAPIVKSQTGPDGTVNFKNHYYAGANGYSDPWGQVLRGIAVITHYPLTKSEYVAAGQIADPDASPSSLSTYYVGPQPETIKSNRAQLPESEWLQYNMSNVAAAVTDYNNQRRY